MPADFGIQLNELPIEAVKKHMPFAAETNTIVSVNTRSVTAKTSVLRRPGEQRRKLAAKLYSDRTQVKRNVSGVRYTP